MDISKTKFGKLKACIVVEGLTWFLFGHRRSRGVKLQLEIVGILHSVSKS